MRFTIAFFALAFCIEADFDAGMRAYQSKEYTTAFNEWLPLAQQGIPEAQYNLGLMYAAGQGVPKDLAQAASWYRKAAEQRFENAEYNLGLLYFTGQGVPQDFQAAEKWLRNAAETGDTNAAVSLGDLESDETHNYAEAKEWYKKACDQGNAKAEFGLGVIFDEGRGVPADPAEALKWYRKAADQGYASALTNMGILYYNGEGVDRDLVQARAYFLLGQLGGDPRAMDLAGWTTNKLDKKQLEQVDAVIHDWQSAHSSH
jgi:hypothetical protein